MLPLIKKVLGIKELERDQEAFERKLSSLTDLVKKLSRRGENLVREVEEIRSSQKKRSANLSRLKNRLQTLREDLKSKVGEEEFGQVEVEISQIKKLLQQIKRNSSTERTVKKGKGQKGNSFTIQDMINQLPSSLRKVVKTLFEGEKPLSYSGLANRIEKKEATARSYVYRLKEKGFPLEFSNKAGERKKVKLPLRVKRQLTVPNPDRDRKG